MQQGGFPLSVSRFENRETPGLERWQRQDLTSGCALGPPACRLAQPLPSVDKLMGRKRPGGLPGFRDAEHAPPARPPAWSHGVALAHALPELCGAPGRPQGPEKSRETLREGTALPPGHHMLCDRRARRVHRKGPSGKGKRCTDLLPWGATRGPSQALSGSRMS